MSEFKVGDQVIAYGRKAEVIEVKNGKDNAAHLVYKDTGEKGWCPLILIKPDTSTEVTNRLAPAELETLTDCEAIITKGLKTFVEVGEALAIIRDQQLYRADHETFEAYLEKRWGISRPRAYQMIAASAVTQTLSTIVDIPPANEAQAREIAAVPAEKQAEAWRKVEAAAQDGKITAALVKEVVKPFKFEKGQRVRYEGTIWAITSIMTTGHLNLYQTFTGKEQKDVDPLLVTDLNTPYVRTNSQAVTPTEDKVEESSVPTSDPKSDDLPSSADVGPEIPPSNSADRETEDLDPNYAAHTHFVCPSCHETHAQWTALPGGFAKCQKCGVASRQDSLEPYTIEDMKAEDRLNGHRRNGTGKPSANGKVTETTVELSTDDPTPEFDLPVKATPEQDRYFQLAYTALQVLASTDFQPVTADGFTAFCEETGIEIIVRRRVPQSVSLQEESIHVPAG